MEERKLNRSKSVSRQQSCSKCNHCDIPGVPKNVPRGDFMTTCQIKIPFYFKFFLTTMNKWMNQEMVS